MITTFSQLKEFIAADLYRYATAVSWKAFCRCWFTPGFRYSFFLRCCQYFGRNSKGPLFMICFAALRHYQFKYGICIHYTCEVGKGLYIGHFGGIVVNPNAKIGQNVNFSPGVLIGLSNNEELKKFEYPTIGDRVFLANNAKITGGVSVGNDAVVGISTVVTKDVPEKAVVVGIPAKVLSYAGSAAYVGSYLN